MKNLLFFTLLNIFIVSSISGQIVKITDLNQNPIQGVQVSDGQKVVFSDSAGIVNISELIGTITFYHKDFFAVSYTKEQLKILNYQVRLMPNTFHIDNIVVSANKWEQPITEVSATIIPVKLSIIEDYPIQTSADLLGATDKVYIQKSQLGGGSPMIRGLAANRILIVIDGVRMNNAIYRSGNLHNVISIDPYILEESEIILGPASNIYGSDALGGVLDFHTKSPNLSTKSSKTINANLSSIYWSANNALSLHFDFNYGTKKFATLTSLSYSNFSHLRMGKINSKFYLRQYYVVTQNNKDTIILNPNPLIQIPTAYSQYYFLQKFKIQLSKYSSITYSFHNSNTSNIPRYDRLIQTIDTLPKYAQWYYGPQHWIMHHLQINNKKTTTFWNNLKIILAYQDYTESRHDRKFNDIYLRHRIENLDILSLNIDAYKTLTKTEIFYGIETFYNLVHSKAYLENILTKETQNYATRYPDGSTYKSIAAYIQFKSKLSEKVILNSGARYTLTSLYAKFDTTFYKFPFTETSLKNSAISGSIGLVWRPKQNFINKLHISTGFRSPNIDDIGKVFDSEPGKVIVPNPNLKPEYLYSAEITSNFFNKYLHLWITAFYSYLDNAIIRDNFTFNGKDSIYYDGELSAVQALVNADYAYIWGIEKSIQLQIFKNLFFKSNLVWINGYDSNNNPLRHVPPTYGAQYLTIVKENLRIEMFIRWNLSIPYEKMPPSEINKPHLYLIDENGNPFYKGWWTLNFSTKYNTKKLTLFLRIENLFDLAYRPYSSGITGPGRNFSLGVHSKL